MSLQDSRIHELNAQKKALESEKKVLETENAILKEQNTSLQANFDTARSNAKYYQSEAEKLKLQINAPSPAKVLAHEIVKILSQLHADVTVAMQYNPNDRASWPTCVMFNTQLEEAKKLYPENSIIAAIIPAHIQSRYRELLPLIGQLKAALEVM